MKIFKKLFYAFTCAALALTAIGVQPARAASIVVNTNADNLTDDGLCTLREAITTANSDTNINTGDCVTGAGADAITFAANYTITLGSQLPPITSEIAITGNGAANTIIQAHALPNTATYRVLQINATGNLTLDGVTVRNGKGFLGGGILNWGTATISASTISGNTAGFGDGGGIYNAGTATISASTLSGNTAGNYGGGIYNWGTATITASTISSNTADYNGGGIYNDGTATITASTLNGNTANFGGGIYNYGTATISASTISGNTANEGGGISNRASLSVANSTLVGNSATAGGGGAILSGNSGTATLTNVTISGSSSASQAAVWNESGTLNLTNTLIANSTGAADCLNSSILGTNVNNLVEDNTCFPALSGDPMLGALANNGGDTQTLALPAGSPAIDAGTNVGCPATDQRGMTRPQNITCDIGAYEYSSDTTPPTVVTTSLLVSYTSPGPNNFTVTFSENVADYAGNANPNDVTNPLNYMVVEDGADSVFNTVSCAGGLAGDDTQATITGVTYNAALYTSTLTLSAALPVGAYRLFVCGTTSIEDPSFNELNGGLSDYTFNFVVAVVPASVTNATSLPKTGFAPNKITTLPAQPAELAYSAMGDLWLEIPTLKVKSTIVGVPQANDKTWNVDWLGNNAGWLSGSAFPTWNGNSVLTAHVTNADGLAGPFANLKELKYGDRIVVHLYGQQYIYEVRETRVERPYATSYAFKSLQDHAYLTLITCQDYNASDDSYTYRRIVRAVLVEVK